MITTWKLYSGGYLNIIGIAELNHYVLYILPTPSQKYLIHLLNMVKNG